MTVADNKVFLGIELGSTRIKAALIDGDNKTIASGGFGWENRLENGIWTYRMEDVWAGLAASFGDLCEDYRTKRGRPLESVSAIGISAMMHGYLPFDKGGKQLAAFRTWRNTCTEEAAEKLTEKLNFNIPQRWSVAHLYQAILNGEGHVGEIDFLTTLSGYVHYQLTGRRVLGIGDASGMFPIDSAANDFNGQMLSVFDSLVAEKSFGWKVADILPKVLVAGEDAGALTQEGARLLDPTGSVLKAGIPLCPPEGDAGTGMVATNSVTQRGGNVSAGTSIFAMIVLEKALSKVYPEIDMVTTPAGKPVAMVHCNNGSSDLDGWVGLLGEAGVLMGGNADRTALYDALFKIALEGEADCGGLLAYNYLSGEHTSGFGEGRPLFARLPDARFTLANFMRTHLYSTVATLRMGMNILTEKEKVSLDTLLGHGGFFKTQGVGQRVMAAALDVPIAVMESAGEGGAWGCALLAAYRAEKAGDETLEDFLAQKVFAGVKGSRVEPDAGDVKGFAAFMERYTEGLAIERAALTHLK